MVSANTVVEDEAEIKRLVAKVNRMLYMEGHVGYSGHVSMRHPETDTVYINARKASRGEVLPEDVVAIDLDNEPHDPDAPSPPSESEIHTSVYRNRDDITACFHTHPQTLTLYSITETDIRPVSQRGSILAEGRVPHLDRPGKITNEEHSRRMLEVMGDQKQLLIKNHGAVVCDETVVRVFARAIYLEKNAELQHRASDLGTPNPMTQEQVERVYEGNWKESSIEKFWRFFEWKAEENGYFPED